MKIEALIKDFKHIDVHWTLTRDSLKQLLLKYYYYYYYYYYLSSSSLPLLKGAQEIMSFAFLSPFTFLRYGQFLHTCRIPVGRGEVTQGMPPVKKIIKERHCIYVRCCGTSIEELKERNAEKPPPYPTYESYGGYYPRANSYIMDYLNRFGKYLPLLHNRNF
jgi:hypothetical protein